MARLLYLDIETDSVDVEKVTKMNVGVIVDADENAMVFDKPRDIVNFINNQDETVVIGHNLIMYDLPILERLAGCEVRAKVVDTLLMSRVCFPDRRAHPAGGNSLECWGRMLGFPKIEYNGPWDKVNADMIRYCRQDVMLTKKLYEYLRPMACKIGVATKLEHDFAKIISRQCRNGVGFDENGAVSLRSEIETRMKAIDDELQEAFPPVPVYLKTKTKWQPFNPNSRMQIAQRLIDKYDWEPSEMTDAGSVKMDEKVLAALPYPEAQLLSEYLELSKILGMVKGWQEMSVDGVIHGSVNTNGAVTGRCTHSNPNLAQVPARSKWGPLCRALFRPIEPGWKMVGCDAKSLELRNLASLSGSEAYIDVVVSGDIHSHNMEIVGSTLCPTRNDAKTEFYAWVYGAQDAKLGSIIGKGKKHGSQIRKRLEATVPNMDRIQSALRVQVERGWVEGIDGRRIPIRSEHAALNTVCQSMGAIIMKTAKVLSDADIAKAGIRAHWMLDIHDEWQLECHPEDVENLCEILLASFGEAGRHYKLACPYEGDVKVGNNWSETH